MSQPTSRIENLSNLRNANLIAAFATAFGALIGNFIIGFVKDILHGSDYWVNMLASLPSLMGLIQIPGAIIGRGFPGYRKWSLIGSGGWRFFLLPLLALPFVPWPDEIRLTILVVSVVGPTWMDWLTEMVPLRSRGWYFGRQQAIATAVGGVVGVLGGLLLDYFRKGNVDPSQTSKGYGVIYAISFVWAIVSFIFMLRMRDLPREPFKQNVWVAISDVKKPFADKSFRTVLIFFVVFIFGQGFAGNLFGAFAIESLKLQITQLQICGVMHAVGFVSLVGFWGSLADKYGNKPLLMMLGGALVITPVMWLFCIPGQEAHNVTILYLGHLFTGATWGGIAVCQLNLLLATAKPEDRSNYLAAGMTVQAGVAGVAPLVGAFVMVHFRDLVPQADQLHGVANAYKYVFGVTMTIRFISLMFLPRVKEEGAKSLKATWQHLRRVTPTGIAAMRSLAKSESAIDREEAIRTVADSKLSLASEEIVKALHDPSPRVRREAAASLAKLGDETVSHGLIHQLEEHPDLVEEETIEALGVLASPSAVESLIKYLDSPRALLRRTSAKALGKIGDTRAVQPLIRAAAQPNDPDLRRAAVQALRLLGAKEASDVVCEALYDSMASVRIAAAEAVAEMELRAAAPFLRQSLEWFDDEASSEVAYALGAVGEESDLGLILTEACQTVSMMTRVRCLLGAARLLGVEHKVYPIVMMEDFVRDKAVMDKLAPAIRTKPWIKEAMTLFAEGREQEAMNVLVKREGASWLNWFVEQPVKDSFIVAAFAIAETP